MLRTTIPSRTLRSSLLFRPLSTKTTLKGDEVIMNRYSRIITSDITQGASQAMLYATDGIDSDKDLAKPMVGIANVWLVFSLFLSLSFPTAERLQKGTTATPATSTSSTWALESAIPSNTPA